MRDATARDEASSERQQLFGTDELPAEGQVLRVGALSVVLQDGNLRYLRLGDVELVRAVAFVVRDTGWGTAAADIHDLVVEEGETVRVSYRAVCRVADGVLAFSARIEAGERRLNFVVEGAAQADVSTNRTGFVVLHPIEGVAGAPLTVTHTDGKVGDTRFPDLVAPWQPATNIRSLRHEAAPGLSVACRLEGDAFEMEDHRNWGDASFKTYIRPLARGFPYVLPAGGRFAQRVEITVEGDTPPTGPSGEDAVRIAIGPRAGAMPAMHLALDPEDVDEALAAADIVAALKVQGLDIRLDARRHGTAQATRLAEASRAIGVPVTLEAIVAGREADAELTALARVVAAAGLPVAELLVAPARDMRSRPTGLPAGEASLSALAEAARAAFPGARVGGGSLCYFTELNRNPPPPGLDFISHTFAANIHDADDGSVMETLRTIPHIARSVRALAPDTPYRIGFAAIAMRESPYGDGPVPNPDGRRLAATRADPRHRALFGAAWGLGFAARAAEAGAEALALAMPTGAFGLVDDGERAGRLTPLGLVVRWLSAGAGSPRRAVTVPDRAGVAALALEAEGDVALWLANLGPTPRDVALEAITPSRLQVLDGSTTSRATNAADGLAS